MGKLFSNRLLHSLFIVFLFVGSISVKAQLCAGSLGDPVVNITFGNGSAGSPIYTAPGYSYTSSSCPNDGSYTITTSTSGCFGGAWHTVNNDHTGGGAFMLVNASYQPGDFFVDTIKQLCPNTNYEFSAWIMNVLRGSGIKPNLTFKIETTTGVVLNQYSTGDVNTSSNPTWLQYGFYFTTGATNPAIVIRITNNAPGGNGNDLALDDITFRPCGPSIRSSIVGNVDTINVCSYLQSVYNFSGVVSAGFQAPAMQWQVSVDSAKTWTDIAGANTINFTRTISSPGYYWYRLTVAETGTLGIYSCRIASNVVAVNVYDSPVVNAGPDRIVIIGQPAILNATITGLEYSYLWSPPTFLSSTTVLNPTVNASMSMSYELSAITKYGCRSKDSVKVTVVAGVFIPTAFTPNGDGLNDTWTIPYLDPNAGAIVRVFNRNGKLVYKADAEIVNWDGRYKGELQDSGVYVYVIKQKDGSVLKGTVTLIR